MIEHLYKAIEEDNIYNLLVCIKNGFDINNINEHIDEGKTPVMAACELEDASVLQLLVESGAKINVRTEKHGDTALLWCAKWGTIDAFQFLTQELIKKDSFNIDIQNNYGETPLMLACYYQNFAIIEEILKHQPNLEITNDDDLDVFESLAALNTNGERDEILHFLTTALAKQTIQGIKQKP